MSKQAEKMYGNSPKLERDEKGDMAVKKKEASKDKDEEGEAEDQGTGEKVPMLARHSMERHSLHNEHEREHHMHDIHGKGDKKEMHERHEKMFKEMHGRQEKELGTKEKTPEMGKD